MVIAFFRHLRSNIVWSTILLTHFLTRLIYARRSKIDDRNSRVFPILIEEQILWLQVSVHNIALVTIINGGQNLLNYVSRILLTEILF